MSRIKQATRLSKKVRLALIGPAGAGKTYSALSIAQGLGRNILVVDTERGSASSYAGDGPNDFQFSVLELDHFAPKEFVNAIKEGEAEGFDVIILDSLSHAWMGAGGALEMVDNAGKRQGGNNFGAWRDVTPEHNKMIEAIIGSSAHIIATMRSKVEYVQEKDPRTGKSVVRKVGAAPIQREGMEYEFDVVGTLDDEHNYIISKTRISTLDNKAIHLPGAQVAKVITDWIAGGAPVEPRHERVATDCPDKIAYEDLETWKNNFKRAFEGTPAATPEGEDKWISAMTKGQYADLGGLINEASVGYVSALHNRAIEFGEKKRTEGLQPKPQNLTGAIAAKVETAKQGNAEEEKDFDHDAQGVEVAPPAPDSNTQTEAQQRAIPSIAARLFGRKGRDEQTLAMAQDLFGQISDVDQLSKTQASKLIDAMKAKLDTNSDATPAKGSKHAHIYAAANKAGVIGSDRTARLRGVNAFFATLNGVQKPIESFADLLPGSDVALVGALEDGLFGKNWEFPVVEGEVV